MIEALLIAAVISFPIILANLGERNEMERVLTYVLLGLLCFVVVAVGLLLILAGFVAGDIPMGHFGEIAAGDVMLYGILLILTGIISALMFFKPIRVQIAKIIDINPGSCVHTTGLILISNLTGALIITTLFMFTGGFEIMERILTEEETARSDTMEVILGTVTQEMLFVLIAFLSVGVLIRRDLQDSLKRLGLVPPTLLQVLIGFGAAFVLLGVAIPIELLMQEYTPESSESMDRVMEKLLDLKNIGIFGALIISVSAGVGEEILFRGAIQPRFGILFTAFLFTLVHVQYPNLLAILMIFIIGVILGILRKKTNTVVPIIAHATYDFILFLFVILIG